ncbi:MAG: NUDIX hydrolase, partial [Cytophagia bacterium]|nr:NUDIX hydrolase [Cytophagia bacterium]
TFAPPQQGWGRPSSWSAWEPTPANYHAPLMEEYVRWTKSQSYLHEKQDWDAKWQRYAAEQKFAADKQAAAVSAALKLKSDEALLNDPLKAIVWEKQPKFDGLKMGAVSIHATPDNYWTGVSDVQVGEPPLPQGLGKVSTGIIVMEDDGRIWVVEPKDHFGGYQHTFPKGKLEADLTAQQNALKELYEEAGLAAEITGFVGDFKGTTGVSRYYLAKRTGGQPWTAHWESQAVKCVPADELGSYLNTERDKEILAVLMAKKTGSPIPPGLKSYVAPAPPPAASAPAPAAEYPFGLNPALYAYSAAKPGGSTPGMVVVHPDAPGEKFLLKQLSDPYKAHAEVAGGAIYRLANEDVIGVEMLDPASLPPEIRGSSRFVTLQRMEPGVQSLTSVVGWKAQPDFSKLTIDQQAQLLSHGIASWIAGDHDGHADQYILSGDTIQRIDLGQALKYTLTSGDRLDLDYHPNAQYGEARPAHMQMLRAM